MPSASAPSGSPTSPWPGSWWPNSSWWRSAAIYQLYVRSFADGDGDGIGDLAGARAHLPYLAALGIDAIWFNPWYPSPMADAGYDIADYRSIDPVFGTLADADALIAEAHAHGIRIVVDVAPNHGSDRHPWFTAALAAGPGSVERSRFWFRPGRHLVQPGAAAVLPQLPRQPGPWHPPGAGGGAGVRRHAADLARGSGRGARLRPDRGGCRGRRGPGGGRGGRGPGGGRAGRGRVRGQWGGRERARRG